MRNAPIRTLLLVVLIAFCWLYSLAPVQAHDDVGSGPEPQQPLPDSAAPRVFLPLVAQSGAAPGASQPAEPPPPADSDLHSHDDYVLAEQARQRNEPGFVAPPVTAAAPQDLINVGQWGPVVTWPFVFATVANLPDGRIVAWGGNNLTSFNGGTNTYAAVYDPATGQFLQRNHSGHSMFCAIPTMLEDGRVFVNGGDGTRERTSIFDYRTNSWTRSNDMNTGHWYPGSVALPSGQVFTALGDPGSRYPELWTPNTGWSYLTGADLQAAVLNFSGYQNNWLPYFFLNGDGRIFHSGPTQQMNWIDPAGNGSVTSANLNNTWYPKYSASIMYDEGKVLVAGGQINGSNLAATNQAMVIDLTGAAPRTVAIAAMANARKFPNGVVLPTGEVLVVGGNTSGTEFSDNGTVLAPEIWNPTTQTWRAVAPLSVPRNYHSVALLLPDGTVFSGGGGLCGCAADHPDHQIYSPPYLFAADGTPAVRPVIASAPNLAVAGAVLTVQATPGMQKFSLVKMAATTHNLNSDLRYLNVPFTETASGQYRLTLRANINVITPGYWMLFAVNAQGVPSVAKVLAVSSTPNPKVTNPGTQTGSKGDAVSLQVAAVSPIGGALGYSATGLPAGLSIDSASGLVSGNLTTAGSYNVTVSASDGVNSGSASFAWQVAGQASIRFVKLEALSEVSGNPWTSVAEFNLLDGSNALIGRGGWVATADSQETQGESAAVGNAIDGQTGTFWHTQWQAASPPPPHWMVINVGVASQINAFRYLPRQNMANGRIANYRFYVSADGVNWGSPVAQGTFPNDAVEKTVSIAQTQPPAVVAPAAQTNRVGDAVNLPVSASDPDGDPLTFVATGLPPGLAINPAGVIGGAPTTAGSYTPSVTVTDSRGFAATATFNWTVQAQSFTLNPVAVAPRLVNTAIDYTASTSNAVNPQYKWLFGDGTPETAFAATPTASHSYAQPGLYVVRVTAQDDTGVQQSMTFVQAVYLPPTGARPAASANLVYETRAGGNPRVWVVNQDNDTVSVFDAATNGKLAEIGVGAKPRSVALAPSGRMWVTNKGDGTISVIDAATWAVVQTIGLPYGSQPYGLVFAPDGSGAYVVLEALGQVLKLDANSGAVVGSVAVGPNPRHLSITADGGTLLVARFVTPPAPGETTAAIQTANAGGEVVRVDARTLAVLGKIVLRFSDKPDTEVQGRGLPNYLGAPVIAPDGVSAWTPAKQDNIQRGRLRDNNDLNFQNTVRAISARIDLASWSEDYAARIDHDNSGLASGAAFDPNGNYLFVALESSREVAVVDVYGRRELFRLDTGRAPEGVVVSPDGTRLYVNNFMDRTVSVFDITNLTSLGKQGVTPVAVLPAVAAEKLAPQVLAGKQVFYDARDPRIARDSYISCAACHNDGGSDGRVWDFTGFGEGLRNTIALQGRGGTGQGPLHWSGNFDEVQDFEGQLRTLAGGTGLMSDADFAAAQNPLGAPKAGKSAELDALAAYVTALNAFPVSPFRNGDGTLTAAGAAGQTVFANANCARCHGGQGFTLSGPNNLQDVGTIKPSSGGRLGGALTGIDIPSLRDVWQSGPYLHDGSAATLADAVRAHNAAAVTPLAEQDVANLAAFLQQVDGNQPLPAPPNQAPSVAITAPANGAVFMQGAAIGVTASAADSDGTVARVEFYAGTTLIGTATTSPYSITWNGATVGSHTLTARAFDNAGAGTTSVGIGVTVNALAANGLLGSYFSNVTLSGAPVFQRVEAVNFNWGTSAPAAGFPANNYSVRWTGRVYAPATGSYILRTISDDGVRLWVNGVQRINNWTDHSKTTNNSPSIALTGGQWYTVVLEYYERGGNAVMQLQWRTPGTTSYVAIPANQLGQ